LLALKIIILAPSGCKWAGPPEIFPNVTTHVSGAGHITFSYILKNFI
jgi:hypothetical protein